MPMAHFSSSGDRTSKGGMNSTRIWFVSGSGVSERYSSGWMYRERTSPSWTLPRTRERYTFPVNTAPRSSCGASTKTRFSVTLVTVACMVSRGRALPRWIQLFTQNTQTTWMTISRISPTREEGRGTAGADGEEVFTPSLPIWPAFRMAASRYMELRAGRVLSVKTSSGFFLLRMGGLLSVGWYSVSQS